MSRATLKQTENQFTPFKPETADKWAALFETFEQAHISAEWLKERRLSAATSFEEQGIPSPKLERWKYCKLAAAVKNLDLKHAPLDISCSAEDVTVLSIAELLSADKAPDWFLNMVIAGAPGAEKYNDMALWELALMFLQDGVALHIPRAYNADKPIKIHVTGKDGIFNCPRIMINMEEGAELTFVEHQDGQGTYWKNAVTQIHVGKNAKLRHCRIQSDSAHGINTQNTHVRLEADATYDAFTLTEGAQLSRNQIHAELAGEGAHCSFSGINLLQNKQLGDTTITIEHQVPNCTSNQFYRSVLADEAHGVFQGKVHVHQIAQKTDGYQLSNALLLSPLAEMDTKPELEIYADDVKCSHGATTGQLDEEPLFYMRARGIDEHTARSMLIQAFLNEVADTVKEEAAKAAIDQKIEEWLHEHAGA